MSPLDLTIPGQLAAALTPDLIVMGGAMLLLLAAVWREGSAASDRSAGALALGVVLLAAGAVVVMAGRGTTAGAGPIAVDRFRWMVDLLILLATAIAIALAMDDNRRSGFALGEGYVLLLFAAAGMMLLAAARDLIIVFLGIELMSMAVYVLAGLERRSARAAEASLKYFLLGAFATGFLLYGIALVYGATGRTDFVGIAAHFGTNASAWPMLRVGIGLLVVGLGFKVAAVPFHMWTPDVYEGAPTPYTAFMAAGVKTAAFAAIIRLWLEAFYAGRLAWEPVLTGLAVVTMVAGNLVALQQKNLKRMLAYSSIAHAGYLLVAVVACTQASASALLFYLLSYTLATMGAFAVIVALSGPGGSGQRLADLAGLWRVRPWLASAMAVFMLALLGFPIAGGMGFWAKAYVLQAAVTAPVPQIPLAVVLVLASVISAGYYLGVVVTMYMRPRADDAPALPPMPGLTRAVIGVAAGALLLFGVAPGLLVRIARDSAPAAMQMRVPAPGARPSTPTP